VMTTAGTISLAATALRSGFPGLERSFLPLCASVSGNGSVLDRGGRSEYPASLIL